VLEQQEETLTSAVHRLAAIAPGTHRILSCYVRLELRDRTRRGYLVELKDCAKALETDPAMLALDRVGRLGVERDLARILEHLSNPAGLPHCRGMALFACEALDLFTAVPLPRVHRTRLILGDTPSIAELAAAEQDSGRLIAVVLDRAHARFFEVAPSGAVELPCLIGMNRRGGKFLSDRADSPGWGEHSYHDRIQEERHRHYADVIGELGRLIGPGPVHGIVIAGPADHTTAVTRFLPRQLAKRLLGTTRLNPTAVTPAQVHEAMSAVVAEHDRAAGAELVASMQESLGEGWAVNGPRETLRALSRGQARTLLLRGDLKGGGFRCRETGHLAISKGDCRDEGDPVPVRDLANEAVDEALRQGVEVAAIGDPDAAAPIEGMAAILRFR
jgi:peptide subunit release factor 1 (eRF1)